MTNCRILHPMIGFERYRYWSIGYWPILVGIGWYWYWPNTKIFHGAHEISSVQLKLQSGLVTDEGHYRQNLRKHYFSACIVNIWNSLLNHVADVNTVNLFKTCLDRFWANQDVRYDFTADLIGIGARSVNEIC